MININKRINDLEIAILNTNKRFKLRHKKKKSN